MATYFPLILESGSLVVADRTNILNFMNFPVTKLYALSSAFVTNLPDPYYIQTSSVNISNADSTTSASVFLFAPQVTPEYQVYITNAILGVNSSTTAGVRIGLQTLNTQDRSVIVKVASTLTGFTYLCQGSDDAFAFALPATLAAANTTYPAYVQGVLGMPSASFSNNILVQSPSTTVATVASSSLFYNQFIGYSSSLSTITSSRGSLYLTSSGRISTLSSGDTVTQSVLPPTASLWSSQILGTAVAVTSNVAYSNIFTLTGLTAGTRYLVNFFLNARSAATTTGVQIRFTSGSTNCRGTIYSPASATAYSIQNSADGTDITNLSTAWPVANTKALAWGEFTFLKSGSVVPALQVKSEINGSAVTIETGSIILYRALQ